MSQAMGKKTLLVEEEVKVDPEAVYRQAKREELYEDFDTTLKGTIARESNRDNEKKVNALCPICFTCNPNSSWIFLIQSQAKTVVKGISATML